MEGVARFQQVSVMDLWGRTIEVIRAEPTAVTAIALLTGGAAYVLTLLNFAATHLMARDHSTALARLPTEFVVAISGALLVYEQTSLTALTEAFRSGSRLKAGDALSAGVGLVPAALWTRFVQAVLLVPCFMALIVPGLIMMVRWCFATQLCVFKLKSGFGALHASNEIVRGRSGEVFEKLVGFWLLQILVIAGASVAAIGVVAVAGGVLARVATLASVVSGLLSLLVASFAIAFYSIWRTELYLAFVRDPRRATPEPLGAV